MKKQFYRGIGLLILVSCVFSLLLPSAYAVASLPVGTVGEEFLPFDIFSISDEEWDAYMVKQANAQIYNPGIVKDSKWIYSFNYANGCAIMKMRLDGSSKTTFDVNWQNNIRAPLFLQGGYLYYLRCTGDQYDLYRCMASGNNQECVISNIAADCVQNDGQYIYYATPEEWESETSVRQSTHHFYRCDLDGKHKNTILNKPTYHFTVFGDVVMYQDDKDNASLHIYNMATKNDLKVNDMVTYWPIYDGFRVSYISMDSKTIYKTNLDGSNTQKISFPFEIHHLSQRGNYYYFTNKADEGRIYRCELDGSNIELIVDEGVYSYNWVGNLLGYRTRNDDWVVCDSEGGNRIVLSD